MKQISRRGFAAIGSSLTLSAAIGLVRPAWAQQTETIMGDGYSVMASDERLTTWVQLIDAGGLQNYARAATPYTTFPAANSAFAEFPGLANSLLGYLNLTGSHNSQEAFPDTSRIVKLVRSHVVAGKHFPAEVMGKTMTVTTVAGTPLHVDGTDPHAVKLTWDSAANGLTLSAYLVDAPIVCTNAVIYIVNKIEKM